MASCAAGMVYLLDSVVVGPFKPLTVGFKHDWLNGTMFLRADSPAKHQPHWIHQH